MTSAQIRKVFRMYQEKIESLLADEEWSRGALYKHNQVIYLKDMTTRFPSFSADREKAMRWICFMQGAFWSLGVYTVDEMRAHNTITPDEEDVRFVYQGHSLHRLSPCTACGDLDGCHRAKELLLS